MNTLYTPSDNSKTIVISESTTDAQILQLCRNAGILPMNGDDCEYKVIDTICGITITRWGISQAVLHYA